MPRLRLHSLNGLMILRRIRAMACLGLSSEDIWICLAIERGRLVEALARMKETVRESRRSLDPLVQAIDRTEQYLDSGRFPLGPITRTEAEDVGSPLRDHDPASSLTVQPASPVGVESARERDSTPTGTVVAADHRPGPVSAQEPTIQGWEWVCTERGLLVGNGSDPDGPAALEWARVRSALLRQLARDVPEDDAALETFRREFRRRPADERLNGIAPSNAPEWAFTRKATVAYAAKETAACRSILESLAFVGLVVALREKAMSNRDHKPAGRTDPCQRLP